MKRKYPKLAPPKECTGCMACVDSCSANALSSNINVNGHIYPKCNLSKCIHCGRCSNICPIVSKFDYNSLTNSKMYAGWANDDTLRKNSASGGIFAALAYKFISIGGCVVGASMQGLEVKHIFIDKIEEIHLIQGTKYQQGNLTGIYNEVKKRLQRGEKILFSGTPCQNAALLSFLSKYKDSYSKQLYTVDIICGGFPSLLPLKKTLTYSDSKIIKIKNFRTKVHGWKSKGFSYRLNVVYEDGSEADWGDDNLIIKAFNSHLTNRESCFNCKYSLSQRKSNLTIADFWGDKDFPEEHYKGLSIIIVHDKKGEEILQQSNITYKPSRWDKFLPFNARMICGSYRILKLHPAHIFYIWLINNLSYKTLNKLYDTKTNNPIWKFYVLLFKTLNKINHISNQIKIIKYLNNK